MKSPHARIIPFIGPSKVAQPVNSPNWPGALTGMPLGSTHNYGQWQMDNLLGEDMPSLEKLANEPAYIFIFMESLVPKLGAKWATRTG